MRDLPRSVCSSSPASLLWTPRIICGNEGLLVGCAPNGPAMYFRVLGCLCYETFLRSACLEWLCQTPCSHVGYLGVSTLHTIKIDIVSPASSSIDYQHYNFNYKPIDDFFIRRTFQDLVGYPRILDVVDLRPLRGRHAYKASTRSALPDSLQPC
jgi:hypothetical protein